jgi:hypothetical protein
MRTNHILLSVAALGLAAAAFSASGPEKRSLRPLAMGNAFVAVVDDKDALYYNPAGLNLINRLGNRAARPNLAEYPRNRMDARVNVFGVGAPLQNSPSFWRFFNNHRESFSSLEAAKQDTTLRRDLAENDGKPINLVLMNGAEFAMNNYGGAYWVDGTVAPYVKSSLLFIAPGVEQITVDAVLQVAAARGFMSERLAIGGGYRLANRQTIERYELDAGRLGSEAGQEEVQDEVIDTAMGKFSNLTDLGSWGHGLDLGVLWQQTPWLRFGGAIQNFGMVLDGEFVTPELTVGAAVAVPMLSSSGIFARKVNVAVDIEDILNDDRNYKPLSKLNFGAEVEQHGWGFVSMRVAGGFKGGYWTAGLGLSLFSAIHIDAVSYAEEGGYYTGQIEDRLYAVQLGLGL